MVLIYNKLNCNCTVVYDKLNGTFWKTDAYSYKWNSFLLLQHNILSCFSSFSKETLRLSTSFVTFTWKSKSTENTRIIPRSAKKYHFYTSGKRLTLQKFRPCYGYFEKRRSNARLKRGVSSETQVSRLTSFTGQEGCAARWPEARPFQREHSSYVLRGHV